MPDGNGNNRDDAPGDVGSAPTTPAPPDAGSPGQPSPFGATLAAGSGNPDATPASEPQAVDNLIGHFRVVRRLGMGGMGVVFACVDADLGRQVAVKLVRDENPAYRSRLLREAQAMARLEHPNVVRIYEVGTDRGRMFIAMELIDGETLTSWLRSFRTWQDVVEMFVQVGAGLAAVHGVGLVHRDFKPDNVLVDRAGRARVADFGLARLDAPGDASPIGQPLTKSGVVMGTPGYMAPEQHFGADVDARADQFSFCIAMREALGGRPVDETRWTKVPEGVRTVVNRGLSYDPADRFPSMKELLGALRASLKPAGATEVVVSPLSAQSPDSGHAHRRRSTPRVTGEVIDAPAKSKPRWVVPLLAVAVLGVGAGIIALVGARRSETTAVTSPRDAGAHIAVTPNPGSQIAPTPDAGAQVGVMRVDAAAELPGFALQPPNQVAHAITPSTNARRDAGVRDSATQIAATAQPAGAPPPGSLPTMSSSPAWGPYSAPWQNAKAGNIEVIRKSIANLGYDGFDATWSKAALEKTVEDSDGVDRAIAKAQLGMLLRKTGDCKGAVPLLSNAIAVLPMWDPKEQALWHTRAGMTRALCTLAAGKFDEALVQVNAAGTTQADLIQLVRGIIAFEQGDRPLAYGHLITAYKGKDAAVTAGVKTYLDGQGLSLGPTGAGQVPTP